MIEILRPRLHRNDTIRLVASRGATWQIVIRRKSKEALFLVPHEVQTTSVPEFKQEVEVAFGEAMHALDAAFRNPGRIYPGAEEAQLDAWAKWILEP